MYSTATHVLHVAVINSIWHRLLPFRISLMPLACCFAGVVSSLVQHVLFVNAELLHLS